MQRLIKPFKRTALALAALVLLGCVAVGTPLPSAPGPASTGPLLLDEVNIVDVETGKISYRQAVWVDDGRISRIADASGELAAPGRRRPVETQLMADGRLRVHAPGRFLLPGLSDMHTHSLQVSPQLHHPLWIAAGVTSVRDMGGCMLGSDSYSACSADRRGWEEELRAGRRTSPHYRQHSSYQLNGGAEVPETYPDFFRLRSPADATALIAHYRAQGTGFIKVYEQLGAQQYRWVAAAAKVGGITLAGHQPWLLSFADMLDAGQRSVEHGRVFLYACADAVAPLKHKPLARPFDAAQWRRVLESQNPALCRELMGRMARSQTWWSPTLLTLQLGARAGDSAFRQDERLKFLPYPLRWMWNLDADGMLKTTHDADGVNVHAELFALAQRQLKQAHDAGVKILAGTDTPDSFVFAGSGLHDELALYVRAGLTPLEAIRTATIHPAVFAGVADRTGSIAVGKAADLLLLEDDPLRDIANLRRPAAVVLAGHWYPGELLSGLQEFSRRQAGSIRLNLRLAWDMARSPALRRQLAD